MVRSELLQKLCNLYPNVLRRDMKNILKIIVDEMINALSQNKNIEIRNFGTYKLINRKARIGKNPKNLAKVYIPEKKAIKWKTSKDFFRRLNKNFTENKISDSN